MPKRSELKEHIIRYSTLVLLIFLFIFSILLVVHSAEKVPLHIKDRIKTAVENPVNSLGLGWTAAELLLSGSPVAAIAIGLNKSGLLSIGSTLFMIIGSRIGAAFIVFLVGVLAYLRNRRYHASVRMGMLTFFVTLFTAGLTLFFSGVLLKTGFGDLLIIDSYFAYAQAIQNATSLITGSIISKVGAEIAFIIGILLLIGSLQFLQDLIPEHKKDKDTLRKFKKPWFAFIAGLLITAITPSVSVSLAILVPLYLKGYFKTKHVIPYILGADIATFTDTLLVASFLGAAQMSLIITIIIAQILATACIFILYEPFCNLCQKYVETLGQRRAILPFLLMFVAVPLVLAFV